MNLLIGPYCKLLANYSNLWDDFDFTLSPLTNHNQFSENQVTNISDTLLNNSNLLIYSFRKSLPFIAMPSSVDGNLIVQCCLTSQAMLKAFPLKVAKEQWHTAESYFTCLI